MATDVATFRIRFPEFEDDAVYPAARIQLFLDDTLFYIGTDENRWGLKYNIAQAYLAAHLLIKGTATEVGDTSAASGPIQSKTAGGVSVTRAVVAKDSSAADSFYSTTSYGQQFLIIRNQCFVGVLVANSR